MGWSSSDPTLCGRTLKSKDWLLWESTLDLNCCCMQKGGWGGCGILLLSVRALLIAMTWLKPFIWKNFSYRLAALISSHWCLTHKQKKYPTFVLNGRNFKFILLLRWRLYPYEKNGISLIVAVLESSRMWLFVIIVRCTIFALFLVVSLLKEGNWRE